MAHDGRKLNRREFLGSAAGSLAFTIVPAHVLGGPGRVPPSDRINVGYIGMGTQGLRELPPMLLSPDIQVTAVCDPNTDSCNYVDWSRYGLRDQLRRFLEDPTWGEGDQGIRGGREVGQQVVERHYAKNKPSGKFKGCAAYADFRELLEKEKNLDAVKIMTPDHLHATIAIAAMNKGKHVATHKPVSNVMREVALAVETSRRTGVATHLLAWSEKPALGTIRQWIDQGAIGRLREIHNWIDKPIWPQWPALPTDTPPVPAGFDWQLWLGPTPERPYHPNYTHAVFRGWYEFGCGILGDMGHYSLIPVFEAFALEAPISVEANSSFTCVIRDGVSGVQQNDVAFPIAAAMRFKFASKGDRPALDLFWYDGGMRPCAPPELEADDQGMPRSGMMFVGDSGKILADFWGGKPRLISGQRMQEFQAPAEEARGVSPGSFEPWVQAIRSGRPSPGSFERVRPLSELVCLGAVAERVGKRIRWDSAAQQVTNLPEANALLARQYRAGWELA